MANRQGPTRLRRLLFQTTGESRAAIDRRVAAVVRVLFEKGVVAASK